MLPGQIKLRIMKKIQYSSNWKRFVEVDKIIIDKFSPIKTEANLCYYIYRRFGEGRYLVLAWKRGHEGFWRFWLGFIQDNGFIRDISKDREMEQLQKQYVVAKSEDEKDNIQEDINFTREINKEMRVIKRRGPIGLIKSKPGQLHEYQEF